MRTRPFLWLVGLAIAASPAFGQQAAKPKLTPMEIKTAEHVFKKTPQGDLQMHLYYPPGWKASDRRPLIVFFFGGGWRNGTHQQFIPQAEYFASRGLVAACADYRILSKHKTTPDKCVEDAKSAVRWLRSKANELGIDPDKVIASGGSAGGHLAAATFSVEAFEGKDDPKLSCKPNALVLFNPALNLKGRGVLDGDGKDISEAFSPTLFLKKGAPPAIIFFGTADRLLEQGQEYLKKSKELGNRAELYTAAEMPHGFFNRSPWTEVTARKADEFLQSLGYLTGAPTIKLPAGTKELKKEEPTAAAPADAHRPPNLVLIFTDDMGYGDLGCYGAKNVQTPNIDRLARDGTRFTSFYVAQAVCTASRAALLSGCYSNRVSLFGALNHTSTIGIHDDELLLSELCKQRGYTTALYGKWHLGHLPKFSPLRHGFDDYLAIPYPNDTSKYHPTLRNLPPLPLIENDKVIAEEPDQAQFTRQFTERAIRFIDKNKDRPFFLYVPHVMPHVPIFASDKFKGRSKGGLYGDVIEELDWSVGAIMEALKKNGIDERTLVIFTNDNGPFLSYGSHAGSSGPLRGGKLTTFEGGVRMPCLMRWPGKVPAGKTCDEIITAMDLLPTVAQLIGGKLSSHVIDGKNVWPVIMEGAKSPHEAFFYYAGEQLQAVRSGDWKLHFPHPYLAVDGEPGRDGKPANFASIKPQSIKLSGLEGIASRHGYKIEQLGLSLYDLKNDRGEEKNVADKHPDVVRRLEALAEKMRADLGDSLTKRQGAGVRPPGRAEVKQQ